MALPRSIAGLARLALSPVRPYKFHIASASTGCTPEKLPPCPPCEPKPRPCCRGVPSKKALGTRITCCPPPQGQRPPCLPRKPACSLNCSNARPLKGDCVKPPCKVGIAKASEPMTKPPCQATKSSGQLEQPRRHFSQCSPAKPSAPTANSKECIKPSLGCIKPVEACKPQPAKPPAECLKPVKCKKVKENAPPCEKSSCRPVKCLEAPREGETRLDKCEIPDCGKTTMECVETPVECIHCEEVSNYVTRRLEAARRARRTDYLREVCGRCPPEIPCTRPYKLQGSTECIGATDGRSYSLKGPKPPPAVCGSCREPPKPCCVELVPDTECQKRPGVYVDPCAHRPKKIVHIARPKSAKQASSNHKPVNLNRTPPSVPHCNPSPAATIHLTPANKSSPAVKTTAAKICAIMKSLTGGSKVEHPASNSPKPANCTPPSAKQESTGKKCIQGPQSGGAKQAGDNSWCDNLKVPAGSNPHCRPLSENEKIHRRPCPNIKCGPRSKSRRKPYGRRSFHTSAIFAAKSKSKGDSGKHDSRNIDTVLRERANLRGAAQGRVVKVQEKCKKAEPQPTCAALELPVPPGAAAVSVNISLNAKSTCSPPAKPPVPNDAGSCKFPTQKSILAKTASKSPKSATPKGDACISRAGAVCISRAVPSEEKEPSWLSLKNLQKKIRDSCKKSDNSSAEKNKLKAASCKPTKELRSAPCVPPLPKVEPKKLHLSSSYPKPNPVCPPTAKATSTQDLYILSASKSKDPCKPPSKATEPKSSPCAPSAPPTKSKDECAPRPTVPQSKPPPCEPASKPKPPSCEPASKPKPPTCEPASKPKSSPCGPAPKAKPPPSPSKSKPSSSYSPCAPASKPKSSPSAPAPEAPKPSPKKNKPSCFSPIPVVLSNV